jgi:hypothetical protein
MRIDCMVSEYTGHSTVQFFGYPFHGYHFESTNPSVYAIRPDGTEWYGQGCSPCMPLFVKRTHVDNVSPGVADILYVCDRNNIIVARVTLTYP